MRRWTTGAMAGCALLLAACGGGDNGGGQTGTAAQTQTPGAAVQSNPAPTQQAVGGKRIFTQNCGVCHTLADAGTNGKRGPNLDQLKPDEATVTRQVTNGGGGMPPFRGRLSQEQIDAVASYVARATGGS